MAKVLVLYYSTYGHVEKMAEAVAEGARSAGAQVDIKRVPETVPEEIAKGAHFKLDQAAPVATVADLEHYDAIVIGTPTRFGSVSSELKAYIDGLGGLWQQGKLVGKAGSVFAGSSQAHGGNEVTTLSLYPVLAHLGLIIVPTGYADGVMFAGAGSPYGASVVSGHPPAGPSEVEIAVARFQGKRVAQVAKKLIG